MCRREQHSVSKIFQILSCHCSEELGKFLQVISSGRNVLLDIETGTLESLLALDPSVILNSLLTLPYLCLAAFKRPFVS